MARLSGAVPVTDVRSVSRIAARVLPTIVRVLPTANEVFELTAARRLCDLRGDPRVEGAELAGLHDEVHRFEHQQT